MSPHCTRPPVHRTIAAALLVAFGMLAGTASAAPFAGAFTQLRSPANGTAEFPEPFTIRMQQATDMPATAGATHTGEWGSAATSAIADLVHGTLGARIAADAPALAEGSQVLTIATAGIVDGIETSGPGGAPFDWTGGSGHFSLSLDGTFTRDPGVDTSLGLTSYVRLSLARPGTMNNGVALRSTDVLADYFWFVGEAGVPFTTCYTDGLCFAPLPLATFTEFPADFGVDVNVGSDFDWGLSMLFIRTATGGSPQFDIDFGQTLTVTYQGPDGTSSRSASGLFGNIVPSVSPVPAGVHGSLAFIGLGAVAWLRRRRTRS